MGQDGQDRQGQDPTADVTSAVIFNALQHQDIRNERRIFWSEIAILLAVAAMVAAYLAALWLDPVRLV